VVTRTFAVLDLDAVRAAAALFATVPAIEPYTPDGQPV